LVLEFDDHRLAVARVDLSARKLAVEAEDRALWQVAAVEISRPPAASPVAEAFESDRPSSW
jgi:hypothetical protein